MKDQIWAEVGFSLKAVNGERKWGLALFFALDLRVFDRYLGKECLSPIYVVAGRAMRAPLGAAFHIQ
jgi:hypothetical protein